MKKYTHTLKSLLIAFAVVSLAVLIYSFGKDKDNYAFRLGLDLSGGVQLLYKADVSNTPQDSIEDSLNSLKEVIERRVNAFGVAEPVVQIERGSIVDKDAQYRLLVELPGFTDIDKAKNMIGKTPLLEFRLQSDEYSYDKVASATDKDLDSLFGPAIISGAHIKRANYTTTNQGGAGISEPAVSLIFNAEGKEKFAELTKENVGKVFGIFLDGRLLSYPVIREPILQGEALISGSFSMQEAKELVKNLNLGALPVPVTVLSTQQIGAALGKDAMEKGVKAGLLGFALISLFMIAWYRLPGFLSVLALVSYIVIMLFAFQFLGITLTVAGIAGFILSLGMALDANVLIFERMNEELKNGKSIKESIELGFDRAWTSIRDGNLSSLITAVILFWFGTSLLKGFAVVFAIGILLSMFSAIYISRNFLLACDEIVQNKKMLRKLFRSLI